MDFIRPCIGKLCCCNDHQERGRMDFGCIRLIPELQKAFYPVVHLPDAHLDRHGGPWAIRKVG